MIEIKVQIPSNIESRLKFLALVSKQPESFYIKEALICYLEDIEDIKNILNSIEENKGQRTYTTEEVLIMLDKNDKKNL